METLKDIRSGQGVTMDIVSNFNKHGLNVTTHLHILLLVSDAFSKFTALIGMTKKISFTMIDTLLIWMTTFKTSNDEIFIGSLESNRTDSDPVFEPQ